MKRSALPLVFGVGPGTDVLETETLAGFAESKGFVARPVVGHHPLDFHPQARVVGDRGLKEGHGAALPLVLHDLAEGDPGSIVDADVNVLLSRTAVRLPVSQSRRYRLPLQTFWFRYK